MKNVIIAASDAIKGDFLVHHWARSLIQNVSLDTTNVVILDYGLTNEQKKILLDYGFLLITCIAENKHVASIRYRDTLTFLQNHRYHTVVLIDCGDVIFQSDVAELFTRDYTDIHAVCETYAPLDLTLAYAANLNIPIAHLTRVLKNKKTINGGFVIGSYQNIIVMVRSVVSYIRRYSFGVDQIALNYYLYTHDFKQIDEKYNFMLNSSRDNFTIQNGVFYNKRTREIIPIIHNNGWKQFLRPIDSFGYGASYNHIRQPFYTLLRTFARFRHRILIG